MVNKTAGSLHIIYFDALYDKLWVKEWHGALLLVQAQFFVFLGFGRWFYEHLLLCHSLVPHLFMAAFLSCNNMERKFEMHPLLLVHAQFFCTAPADSKNGRAIIKKPAPVEEPTSGIWFLSIANAGVFAALPL